MRVLVTGDRNYDDGGVVRTVLAKLRDEDGLELVVQGEARGADLLAREAALELGL